MDMALIPNQQSDTALQAEIRKGAVDRAAGVAAPTRLLEAM